MILLGGGGWGVPLLNGFNSDSRPRPKFWEIGLSVEECSTHARSIKPKILRPVSIPQSCWTYSTKRDRCFKDIASQHEVLYTLKRTKPPRNKPKRSADRHAFAQYCSWRFNRLQVKIHEFHTRIPLTYIGWCTICFWYYAWLFCWLFISQLKRLWWLPSASLVLVYHSNSHFYTLLTKVSPPSASRSPSSASPQSTPKAVASERCYSPSRPR